MRRSGLRLGLGLAFMFASIVGSSPAGATAAGTSGFGPRLCVKGVCAPMGSYWVQLTSKRLHVSNVKAWPQLLSPVGNICNWNVTAEFFDTSDHWYQTFNAPVHRGCNSYWNQADAVFIIVNKEMKPGKMCSTLKSNGTRKTSVCHNFF